jgi:hypothetical protein
MPNTDLSQIVAILQAFAGTNLTATLARLEGAVQTRTIAGLDTLFEEHRIHGDALSAAAAMKQIAGQINVVIHSLGILLSLPHLLEEGEIVEYVSLGAGNTGRAFDLETDRRIAEFKFINWRGGPESIRQNGLFRTSSSLPQRTPPSGNTFMSLAPSYPLNSCAAGGPWIAFSARTIRCGRILTRYLGHAMSGYAIIIVTMPTR